MKKYNPFSLQSDLIQGFVYAPCTSSNFVGGASTYADSDATGNFPLALMYEISTNKARAHTSMRLKSDAKVSSS